MNEVETELARVGHIATSQPGGSGCQVHYSLTGTRGALRAELDAMLGDRRALFDKMLADLGTLESKGVEAVTTTSSTCDACWLCAKTKVGAAAQALARSRVRKAEIMACSQQRRLRYCKWFASATWQIVSASSCPRQPSARREELRWDSARPICF